MFNLVIPVMVAFLLCAGAAIYAYLRQIAGGLEIFCGILACFFYSALLFSSFNTANLRRFTAYLQSGRALIFFGVLLWLPHLILRLVLGKPPITELVVFAAFIFIPVILLVAAARGGRTIGIWDFAVILCLWLPFDLRLLDATWPILGGGLNYALATLVAMNLAVGGFVLFRGHEDVGYAFKPQVAHLIFSMRIYFLLLAVCIPLAWATDFIAWNPQLRLEKIFALPMIILFIALPEELLFRGLIQNFLQQKTARPYLSLGLTALLFGLTHLNNPPLNDLRYVGLAFICGLFYGYAWLKTRRLFAPVLIHGLVDWVWVLFLWKH